MTRALAFPSLGGTLTEARYSVSEILSIFCFLQFGLTITVIFTQTRIFRKRWIHPVLGKKFGGEMEIQKKKFSVILIKSRFWSPL